MADQTPTTASCRLPAWCLLLLYFSLLVLGGAVLAPPLFFLGKSFASWVDGQQWHNIPLVGALAHEAAKADFQRYFNRAVLVCALVFLWPTMRMLRLGRAELPRLRPQPGEIRDGIFGFLLAGGFLLGMGFLLLHWGVFKPNPKAVWSSVLMASAMSAAAVAVLEEYVFRGALTSLAQRAWAPLPAMVFIAALFAVLHFMHPPEALRIADDEVAAWKGLELVGIMFGQLFVWQTFTGGFLTLLAVGLMLGWARLVTGGLWLAMGLHAGWVFALKAFSGATRRAKSLPDGFPEYLIGKDLKTGLLPLGFLLATALCLGCYLRMTRAARTSRPRFQGSETQERP